MNSFDLFDTLVAGRDINTPCGDQKEGQHFVIAENLAKVQPDDVIISDYYDPEKAQRIVTNVLGLKNKLIVGNGIKASGEVFRFHPKPVHHTDDKEYAVNSARREGIQAALVQLSPMTKVEKEIYELGMRGLALSMREGRLTTYAKPSKMQDRQLQLMQTQANFPMMFCAALLLHRKMVAEKRDRLLLCSRDMQLSVPLQQSIRNIVLCKGNRNRSVYAGMPGWYEVDYFLNSRLTRYKPSDDYMVYANSRITPTSLIVDLCGSGWSLRHFQEHFEPKPDCLLLIGYENMGVNPHVQNSTMAPLMPYMFPWMGSDTPEMANFAKHPMIADVQIKYPECEVVPTYSNVKDVDWENHPQIAAMHDAFNACLEAVKWNYDLKKDINVSDDTLKKVFKLSQRRVEDARPLLRGFSDAWFYAEEQNTRGEVLGRQPLIPPKTVRPRPGMPARGTL